MMRTIRVRLTLWYGALLAVALLVFAGTVYAITANTLTANLDRSLMTRLDHAKLELRVRNGHPMLERDEEPADERLIPTALILPSGWIASGPVPPEVRRVVVVSAAGIRFRTVGTLRVATEPPVRDGRLAGTVVTWQSERSVNEARQSLLLVMLAAGPILLLVAVLGGLLLAARALRPIRDVTQTAAAISVRDLTRRVPIGQSRDELSELAATFNAMIDRLEAAVQRERRFTADASHELRAPLAVIRAEATLALERPRPADAYQEALQVIDEEAASLEDVIAALLALARAESAPESSERVPIAEIVDEGVADAWTEETGIRVSVDVPEDITVVGNSALLSRAVRNIVENALRFSPAGGAVCIRAFREGACAVIEIRDEGPGIAPVDQARIFEPFYQVQPARTPGASHGLGLAICRRIVDAHGGEVTVKSELEQGAVFRIALPL